VRVRSAVTVLFAAAVLVPLVAPAVAADQVTPPPPTVLQRMGGLAEAQRFQAAQPIGVSEAVAAPIPFSLLGFELPGDVDVTFRTSMDGKEWTAWTPVEPPDESPDPNTAEAAEARAGMSEPVWVGRARWLQVSVVGASPADVGVHLIDSLGLSRSFAGRAADALRAAFRPASPAAAMPSRPAIVTRAEWGADESWRKGTPSYSRRVRLGVVHHTAGSNSYSAAEAPAVVRGIYAYHTRSLGWSDIGYNLLVDRYGTIYEGRYGGLEENVIGAHAGGFNAGSFGISVLGTFTSASPPPAAFEATARALAWKFDVHHLDVTGTVTVASNGSTRFPKGQQVTLPTLIGHRDVSKTACPGDAFYQRLGELRHRVLELGGDVLLDHDATPAALRVSNGKSLDGPVTFTSRLRPAGEWRFELRDPAGTIVHTAEGSGDAARVVWDPLLVTRGRYTYTFSSPGRRSASDWIEFIPPVIHDAAVSPAVAKAREDGRLAEAVTVSGDAWDGASWRVTVRGPGGDTVFLHEGQGARVSASWSGPASQTGEFRWMVEAGEADPVGGTFSVFRDVLRRVGDAGDPVGGAVGVSHTAFPAPSSAAHAVLARHDVFADAMAGGPLAGTLGPVLLTPPDRLDGRVRAELDRLLPAEAVVYVLGGEAALGEHIEAELAERWTVVRLAGSGRIETAARIATEVVRRTGATTALVARAGPDEAVPWADALSGGAYGAAQGLPVLLTHTHRLPEATQRALRNLGARRAIVLGGTAAVSETAVSALPDPQRVFGKDRAGTAAAVAAELWGRRSAADGDHIVLADGYHPSAWTLALAAAPLAGRNRAPLVLANAGSLPPSSRDYLAGLGYGPGRTGAGWVLGSTADVSQPVADAVSRLLQ
jgi:putative cell wall-binding protein